MKGTESIVGNSEPIVNLRTTSLNVFSLLTRSKPCLSQSTRTPKCHGATFAFEQGCAVHSQSPNSVITDTILAQNWWKFVNIVLELQLFVWLVYLTWRVAKKVTARAAIAPNHWLIETQNAPCQTCMIFAPKSNSDCLKSTEETIDVFNVCEYAKKSNIWMPWSGNSRMA